MTVEDEADANEADAPPPIGIGDALGGGPVDGV
jgi:hypothetical protein